MFWPAQLLVSDKGYACGAVTPLETGSSVFSQFGFTGIKRRSSGLRSAIVFLAHVAGKCFAVGLRSDILSSPRPPHSNHTVIALLML